MSDSVLRTPDEIMTDFAAGIGGHKDVDMYEVLHEILADIVDSAFLLAHLGGVEVALHVKTGLEDYITNNYGED